MAERRMLSKAIVDSDAFLTMPQSAQNLYFHLNIRADDDGFVNNPKSIMRLVGCNDDDANILIAKKFILAFESGIIVIKHWRIHNYIRKDTYQETRYKDEKKQLLLDENNAYTRSFVAGELSGRCESVTNPSRVRDEFVTGPSRVRDESLTQDRIGKDRIGKDREDIRAHEKNLQTDGKNAYGEFETVKLTQQEYEAFLIRHSKPVALLAITYLDEWQAKRECSYPGSHLAALNGWPVKKALESQGYEMPKEKPAKRNPKWVTDKRFDLGVCVKCQGIYRWHYDYNNPDYESVVLCEKCKHKKPKEISVPP